MYKLSWIDLFSNLQNYLRDQRPSTALKTDKAGVNMDRLYQSLDQFTTNSAVLWHAYMDGMFIKLWKET